MIDESYLNLKLVYHKTLLIEGGVKNINFENLVINIQ